MLTNKLHHTPARHKILLTLIIYCLFLGINLIGSNMEKLMGNLLIFVFSCIASFLIFKYVKTTQILSPRKVKKPFGVILIIILLGYFFVVIVHPVQNIIAVFSSNISEIINSLLIAITAGIFEEFLVRVLLLDGMTQLLNSHKYGILQASIYSSTIFGILHLSNLTFQPVNVTFQQILYAIVIGLMLSLIRLQTNGISICILIHTIIDFQPHIDTNTTQIAWSTLILIFLPVLILSIWGIYQINRRNINDKI